MDLKDFIEYHRSILDVANKFKNIFKEIVFFEYLFMTILLCIDGFEAIEVNEMSKKNIFVFHAINSMIDMVIYSCGGSNTFGKCKVCL